MILIGRVYTFLLARTRESYALDIGIIIPPLFLDRGRGSKTLASPVPRPVGNKTNVVAKFPISFFCSGVVV